MPLDELRRVEVIKARLPKDEAFWNWFAGFWEGDGNFDLYEQEQSYKGRVYPRYQTHLGVTNNCLEILHFIKKTLKLGRVYEKKDKGAEWIVFMKPQIIAIGGVLAPYLRFRRDEFLDKLERTKELWERYLEKKNFWTDEGLEFLRRNYKRMTERDMGKVLGRSHKAVNMMKRRLGLSKYYVWTSEDDECLRENYGKIPAKEIAKDLEVSVPSVYHRAKALNLKAS